MVESSWRARETKGKRGRPEKTYRLSDKLLGENFDLLADMILATWLQTLPAPKRASAVQALAEGMTGQIGRIEANLGPAKRLVQLTEKLNGLHYQARWEAGAEGPRDCARSLPVCGHHREASGTMQDGCCHLGQVNWMRKWSNYPKSSQARGRCYIAYLPSESRESHLLDQTEREASLGRAIDIFGERRIMTCAARITSAVADSVRSSSACLANLDHRGSMSLHSEILEQPERLERLLRIPTRHR